MSSYIANKTKKAFSARAIRNSELVFFFFFFGGGNSLDKTLKHCESTKVSKDKNQNYFPNTVDFSRRSVSVYEGVRVCGGVKGCVSLLYFLF